MRHKGVRAIAAAVGLTFFLAIAWAQSGGQVGTLTWDSGFPNTDSSGTGYGQGTYSFPAGSTSTGTMAAYLPAETQSEFYVFEGVISFFPKGDGGTWKATVNGLPVGSYLILAEADLSVNGSSEVVMADFASLAVGGNKPKVDPGKVNFTAGPTGNKQTIQASGTFQSNKGWQVNLGSFKALAVPVTPFGKLDGSRKAVPGKVTVDAINGKWSLNMTNITPGLYWVFVGADFSELGNPDNVKKKAAMKPATVSQ